MPRQGRPEDAGRNNEPQRGESADALADLDEEEYLDERVGDEQDEEATNGVPRSIPNATESTGGSAAYSRPRPHRSAPPRSTSCRRRRAPVQ